MYEQFWKDRIKNIKITGNQINGDCPVCNKSKHFYTNIDTGQFDCKRCGISGNTITYLKDYEHKSNGEIAELFKHYSINETFNMQPTTKASPKLFRQDVVDDYVANLPEDKLKEFSKERGLSIEILKKYKLGLDKKGNFTLPIYDAEGRIRDVRRRQMGKKTIASLDANVFLFGIKDLLANNRVFLTEGEWSKMALEVQGYPSVGVPGAGTFKDEWIPYFKDKEVYIVFDLDSGGEQGTKRVIEKLNSIAKEIRIIHLPKELGEGQDIRNFFNNDGTKEQFEELIKQAEVVKKEAQKTIIPTLSSDIYHLTDLGNAERLVTRYIDILRYCHPWHKWLIWDDRRWEVDVTAKIWRYAIETVRHIYTETEGIQEKNLRKSIANHAIKSESEARINAMVSLAEKQEGIPLRPEELDKDPWLLNILNGTVNLRTIELRPHSKDDLITKIAPVNYDNNASCPKWLDFLNKIMFGNETLIQFLQRITGYCLTGKVSEQKLFFLFGTGANGKTTFLKVLQGILGDYAIKTASDILIAKPIDSHPTSITDLKGARLAITIEVQEGKRLAEVIVKELTGGDSITARRMREDNMTFEPTHKIILAANHKPIVHESTIALWRRIDLIPFNYVFPEQERIKDYHEILLNEEKDGIFMWALKGCQEWQKIDLSEPPEVITATKEYKTEMDILGDFIADCCVIGQNEKASRKEIREAYAKWCQENGEKEVYSRILAGKLREKGFSDRTIIRGQHYWKGIGLQLK